MNRRIESRREASLLACTLSLALLAASAAPAASQTTAGVTPGTGATQPAATTKATATAKVPAATTAQPTSKVTTTTTTVAPSAQTTTTPTTAKKPAATSTAAGTTAPTATATGDATKATPGTTAPAAKKTDGTAKSEGDYTLRGGQEGTVFKSLTIEGEDRIRVDYERPPLDINLDLDKAPGLDWGSAADVLNRSNYDVQTPLTTLSARQMTPYLARPWLSSFASGPVARFRPNAEGVDRWKLVVVNSKGTPVRTFSGKGNPPAEIAWDGRATDGSPLTPGLTYSYVIEAFDRAGNKRNVVGQGFSVTTFRLDSPEGPTLLFSGTELNVAAGAHRASAAPGASEPPAAPILLETASWLNQSDRLTRPIVVTATARSQELADQLAQSVKRALAPLVLGDPMRLEAVAVVEADAPEAGTLAIGPGR